MLALDPLMVCSQCAILQYVGISNIGVRGFDIRGGDYINYII